MGPTLSAIGAFLVSLLKIPITLFIAFFAGKSSGKKDAELEQHRESLDAIAAAEDARNNLHHDDDSVREDPFNRHNRRG